MKPRICEILGVEVGENFDVLETGSFFIDENGFVFYATSNEPIGSCLLLNIINSHCKIIRKPHVTDEEKEILWAMMLLHDAKWIIREINEELYTYDDKPIKTRNEWDSELANFAFIPDKYQDCFKYIQWSDAEPTLISDLLGK